MSFLHQLYVGDFELTDGSGLRMARTTEDPVYRPVVRRPLDPAIMGRLASDSRRAGETGGLPIGQAIRAEGGYLVCNRYELGVEEIQFLRRLRQETHCRIFERGFEVSPDDLTASDLAVAIPARSAGIRRDPEQ